jgi:molybdenum cofactor cytidylyltransferase
VTGRPDPPAPPGRVAAVLLAAGEGRRYGGGGHKLLADLAGRPLVAWAVEAALGAGLDALCVVTGAVDLRGALESLGGVAVVDNPAWREGQATSLRAGLRWCEAGGFEAAVVGLGDQPLVPVAAWRQVAGASHRPIVTATYAGRRRPPVRLHRSVWELLPTGGDEGARALMRRRPDLVGAVACEGEPADVDTLDDLRRVSEGHGVAGAPSNRLHGRAR